VYNQRYESGAQFWPSVHGRIIIALIISQLVLLGLLGTKDFEESTPALLVLPVLTFWFYKYCKNRYEPAFMRNPLQVILFGRTSLIRNMLQYLVGEKLCLRI
jgi:calcium permeable stress-gated cation channel